MRRWIARPQLDDEYETFAARVLHYTLLLLLGIALLFIFFISSPAQFVFIPVFVAMLGSSYYLLHRGRLRLASVIFVSGLWTIITVASFSINGIRNASLSAYVTVIIYSAVLISGRAVVVVTAMSVLSAIILVIGESLAILPLRTTPLYLADRFFQQVALFSAAGILLSAASRVIRGSFWRIRSHEETLLERNQTLELEIAERRRTEANLRISEERYRLLFENIPVMASVYAQDGEIILLNNVAAQTFGGQPATLQGRNLRDMLELEDGDTAIRIQAEVLAEGQPRLTEGHVRLRSGHELYYLRHIIPLPDPSGGAASQVLVLTTDVTERYQAEQRERELALAQERNHFLADFFSTLSHDLKTPLSVMSTSLYLLERAETAQQRGEKLSRMADQISLMDRYIQDMLTISRLEHLPAQHFEVLDLNPLVDQVLDLLRPRIEGKQLTCQFDGQTNLPVVRGDQEQCRRLLMNLIENAVNYTPSGGQVNVKTYSSEALVALEVMDNGVGIEAEALPHIFDRFFRSSSAKAIEHGGTGLGLAIVKKIVEMHSATIEVASAPGEGTKFCVQFPAEPTDA